MPGWCLMRCLRCRYMRALLMLLAAAIGLPGALRSAAQPPDPLASPTPVVPVPPPVDLLEDDAAIQNILLLGADTSASKLARTDVVIVASINRRAGSVALWHV